jgi:MFS family permease
LAAPLIGGGLVESFGYQALFLVSLIIAVIAFVIIKGFVKEPRWENGNGQL